LSSLSSMPATMKRQNLNWTLDRSLLNPNRVNGATPQQAQNGNLPFTHPNAEVQRTGPGAQGTEVSNGTRSSECVAGLSNEIPRATDASKACSAETLQGQVVITSNLKGTPGMVDALASKSRACTKSSGSSLPISLTSRPNHSVTIASVSTSHLAVAIAAPWSSGIHGRGLSALNQHGRCGVGGASTPNPNGQWRAGVASIPHSCGNLQLGGISIPNADGAYPMAGFPPASVVSSSTYPAPKMTATNMSHPVTSVDIELADQVTIFNKNILLTKKIRVIVTVSYHLPITSLKSSSTVIASYFHSCYRHRQHLYNQIPPKNNQNCDHPHHQPMLPLSPPPSLGTISLLLICRSKTKSKSR
jgi:hypothetical protein